MGPRMVRWTNSRSVQGAVVLLLVTLLATEAFSPSNLYVYDDVLLACLGAIALTVLIGTAGQVSFGNPVFLAAGAFGTVWALSIGIPFPLDVVFATVASGLVGLLVGLPGVRLRGLELALATLAAFFISMFLATEYENHTSGASGGFTVPTLFGSKSLRAQEVDWAWLLSVVVVLIGLGAYLLMRSKSGRALRTIRDHELIAPTLGIPVLRYKLAIFAASSAVIGLEGSLSAHFLGSVTEDNYTLTVAVQYLAMVVIGGLDSVGGAVVGAAVVIALPNVMTNVFTPLLGAQDAISRAPQIANIAYFGLLLVFLVAAPNGLAGLMSPARRALSRINLRGHPRAGTDADPSPSRTTELGVGASADAIKS